MSQPKPKYTPMPAVPPELMPRLAAVLEVMAGVKTVSAAARSLGLSRNHFQSLLHRGIAALVAAIAVQPGGRPATPPAITTLQAQLKRAAARERATAEPGGLDRALAGSSERVVAWPDPGNGNGRHGCARRPGAALMAMMTATPRPVSGACWRESVRCSGSA